MSRVGFRAFRDDGSRVPGSPLVRRWSSREGGLWIPAGVRGAVVGYSPGRRVRRLVRRRIWRSDTVGSTAVFADPLGGRDEHTRER